MTDFVPLSELNVTDSTRRDGYGRYLIVPPAGGPPVGYSRVTTIAKTLDSMGGLAPWKASMTATGIIMRKGLRSEWEALLALYGDPWYSGDLGKKACKELVEKCAAVGGANDRKEMGSALHTLTALVDLGRAPTHLTDETLRDLNAYVEARNAAGIEVVEGMIEVTVVIDAYQVAGTFDRLVTVPGFDLPLISDLKTGANLEYSWQSIAVQMAAYSRGDAIYKQGAAKDGSQDQRLPMPAVDQSWGLVFWLPADAGELHLFLVNLDQGWEAFGHSMWVRGWHNADVAIPYDPTKIPTSEGDLVKALQASLDALERPEEPDLIPPHTCAYHSDDGRCVVCGAAPPPVTVEDIRAWLQERINLIGQDAKARKDLGLRWPPDIPTLRSSQGHTPEQLDLIERLLDEVEGRFELPFGAPKPGSPLASVVQMFPGSTVTHAPTTKDSA